MEERFTHKLTNEEVDPVVERAVNAEGRARSHGKRKPEVPVVPDSVRRQSDVHLMNVSHLTRTPISKSSRRP